MDQIASLSFSRGDTGRAGEFLVMSRLSAIGLYCVHSDSYSDDIWVKLPDSSIFTMQVRATSRKARPSSYGFKVPDCNAHVLAFGALDIERVLFMLPRDTDKKFMRVKAVEMTEQAELCSLLHVLDKGFGVCPTAAD